MSLLLRTLSIAFIFALLADPARPPNWLLGALLAAPLAFAVGGIRATPPATAIRLVLLPWFLLGILLRVAGGAVQVARLLLLQRDWSSAGLVDCPSPAETRRGRMLLGIAETISPASSIVSAEEEIRLYALDARPARRRCRRVRDWYDRFQRPMLR